MGAEGCSRQLVCRTELTNCLLTSPSSNIDAALLAVDTSMDTCGFLLRPLSVTESFTTVNMSPVDTLKSLILPTTAEVRLCRLPPRDPGCRRHPPANANSLLQLDLLSGCTSTEERHRSNSAPAASLAPLGIRFRILTAGNDGAKQG